MRKAARILGVLVALLVLAMSHVGCASRSVERETEGRPVKKSG